MYSHPVLLGFVSRPTEWLFLNIVTVTRQNQCLPLINQGLSGILLECMLRNGFWPGNVSFFAMEKNERCLEYPWPLEDFFTPVVCFVNDSDQFITRNLWDSEMEFQESVGKPDYHLIISGEHKNIQFRSIRLINWKLPITIFHLNLSFPTHVVKVYL